MRWRLLFGGLAIDLPRRALAGAGACVAVGFLWGWAEWPGPTRLTFLAVGQGDCTVFQHEGTTVLVDAGPRAYGVDAGQRIVVPKLAAMGVKNVDLLFLTHPDEDHVGGVGAILRAFPSAKVAISAEFRDHEGLATRLREWKLDPERVLWLGSRHRMAVGKFLFEIANPDVTPSTEDNDGSTFLRISSGRASAVLSGDASQSVEIEMAAEGDWGAQVLKAGHHGSATSSGHAWLIEVSPKYAVVSCGRDNVYGHPAKSVVHRLKSKGITTLRTDQEGDLVFLYDKRRGFVLR